MRLKRGGIPWCSEGENITLKELHSRLNTDDAGVRARIDAHLLGPVLDRDDTFHYHNLPDLTRYFRKAIATGCWNDNIICCIMQSTFVNAKKNKVFSGTTRLTERAALANTLHGLLLGLYPYNTKHMTWDHRVKIVKEVRKAMTHSDFVKTYHFLIQLSVTEYLNNVLPDFCPVEEQLVGRNHQLRFSINQQCEQYRSMATEIIAEEENFWTRLNNLAESALPPIIRLLKNNQTKLSRPSVPACKDTMKFGTLMDFPRIFLSCSPMAQLNLLFPYMEFDELQALESIMGCISIANLPKKVADEHIRLLEDTGGCSVYQKSKSHIHVCFPCAIRSKSKLLTQKFAFNCRTSNVQCSACSMPAIAVNMIGRVLSIKGTSYYLCTSCLKPCIWENGLGVCKACNTGQVRAMDVCVGCTKRTYEVFKKVLDVDCLQLMDIPLCFKHSKNFSLCHKMIFDMPTFLKQLDK